MLFNHHSSSFFKQFPLSTNKFPFTIVFKNPNITVFKDINNKEIFIEGILGKVRLETDGYISNTKNSITVDRRAVTPAQIAEISSLEKGLDMGYMKTLYHKGVWTIMDPIIPYKKVIFNLGYSHSTSFLLPKHIHMYSKRIAQLRYIRLYSISKELLAQTAAKLVKLKPADVYKLNGFYYITKKTPILKSGKQE